MDSIIRLKSNPCDFVIYVLNSYHKTKHVDCTMIMRTKTTTNIWWVKPPTDWFCLNKDETFKGIATGLQAHTYFDLEFKFEISQLLKFRSFIVNINH